MGRVGSYRIGSDIGWGLGLAPVLAVKLMNLCLTTEHPSLWSLFSCTIDPLIPLWSKTVGQLSRSNAPEVTLDYTVTICDRLHGDAGSPLPVRRRFSTWTYLLLVESFEQICLSMAFSGWLPSFPQIVHLWIGTSHHARLLQSHSGMGTVHRRSSAHLSVCLILWGVAEVSPPLTRHGA